MSSTKSIDSSTLTSSKTTSSRSSYFQTEFVGSCDCGVSDVDSQATCDCSVERSQNKRSGFKQSLNPSSSTSLDERKGKEGAFVKERKKWERPPVVVSTDPNVLPYSQSSVSESEGEEVQSKLARSKSVESTDFSLNKKDSEKTLEGSSDLSLPGHGESSDPHRVPSPSSVSSATSRPLEWDSGADVGYYQQFDPNQQHDDKELSSIERLALDQGRKGILVRSDPEVKSNSKRLQNSTVINIIGIPASESTPISLPIQKVKKDRTLGGTKISDSVAYQHLYPEVIIEKKGNQSDSSHGSVKDFSKSKCDSQPLPPKRCSSLKNVSESRLPEQGNATFPRSQSQLNIEDDPNPVLNFHATGISNPPQSVSSSSVATVVTGTPHKSSKHIRKSSHKNNSATQSTHVGPVNKEANSATYTKSEQNQSSTLESNQMTADDRVNSFEYLPGHMYENVHKSDESEEWAGKVSTLKEDVERGVQLLEQFIQGSNANNTLMKKDLIQRVVRKLIQTDYPEDELSQNSFPLRCSTRRSQNRDGAVGESSSENAPASNEKSSGNSTSMSGQSSSAWVSVTESSKSSDPSLRKESPKKSSSMKKREPEDDKKRPKSSTDYTSDTKSDWKAPITRTEKLYESRKRGGKVDDEDKLVEFLNSEREKQLHWIVKEIDHLSNLKCLLEKHERLRRNLQRLKKERQNKELKVGDDKSSNQQRSHLHRRKPLNVNEVINNHSTVQTNSQRDHKKLIEDESWDSHNYDTSDRLKLKKTVSTETRKEDINGVRRSTAYTITFENTKPKKTASLPPDKPLIADRQTLAKESKEFVKEIYPLPTLQDYLLVKRPDVVKRAELRRKTVSELSVVRQLRQERRPVVLATASLSSDGQRMPPPPPPLVKRVVSQKEMRRQTEAVYRQTFEVKKKVYDRKLQESLKTNRLMADVYKKRLQLLTLKGHTDLSNSVDVIYTV